MSQTDSSTSIRSAERFGLDDTDKTDILVYKYRKDLEISSQSNLCQELDKDTRYRCSKKSIPRGNSRLEIQHCDLYPEKLRAQWKEKPNYKTSVASIRLPTAVRIKRLLFDQYKDLYIVSPDSSPESTPENSKYTSPTSSFPQESPSAEVGRGDN